MGIERVVTDEMVFETADQLAAKGEKVTNRAIWSAIGGGSMTTISQALRRWRERQDLRAEPTIERAPLPSAVADVMYDAVSRLWHSAQAETQAELDQLTQAMNTRVAEAQGERDEALAELQSTVEELEQVRTERNEARAEIEHQAEQLTAATAEIEQLRADLRAQTEATAAAIHRADTTEAARAELQVRVDQIGNLMEREREAHAQAETEARRQTERAAGAIAERDGAHAQIEQLRKDQDDERKRHHDEASNLNAALLAAQEAAAANASELSKARRELESARVSEQTAQARLESATREIEQLRKDKAEAEERARKAGEEAAELRGRLTAYSDTRESSDESGTSQRRGKGSRKQPSAPQSESEE